MLVGRHRPRSLPSPHWISTNRYRHLVHVIVGIARRLMLVGVSLADYTPSILAIRRRIGRHQTYNLHKIGGLAPRVLASKIHG